MRCFLNVASLLQSRVSVGNEFQADGAEMAKALSINQRWVRGVMIVGGCGWQAEKDCGRQKSTCGCMAVLTLTFICVADTGLLVIIQ